MGDHLWLAIVARLYIDQATPQVAQVPYTGKHPKGKFCMHAFWVLAIRGKIFTVAFPCRLILLIDKAMICRKRFVVE